MAKRAYNFCSGPAALPLEVLQQAQAELLDYQGCGASVMELSHRGDAFLAIVHSAHTRLRRLLGITDDYRIVFMQGGATAQFSTVPLNLLGKQAQADYIVTCLWSHKAWQLAQPYGDVQATGPGAKARSLPDAQQLCLRNDSAYVHYTPNETISGVEFAEIPDVGEVPLVADFSSSILSQPIDVGRFGLIYAGAQKNIGPAGLTLVIVHEALLQQSQANLPLLWQYAAQAQHDSLINTPPTFAIYLADLVFAWLERQGGLAAMAQHNAAKAQALYAYIDSSQLYRNDIDPSARSRMNIPFWLQQPDLEALFLQHSEAAGLLALQGHRSIGGLRASVYNAMPLQGVMALIDFMRDFEAQYAP